MIAAAAITMLALAVIRRDGGTQFRQALDSTIVEEYAALLRDSDAPGPLPPVVAFYDGSSYWLADGFYRTAACDRIGRSMIPCEVRPGTVRDARIYAATEANHHGVRMTPMEKRTCVMAVLQDEEGRGWSDREIARRCGVGYTLVAEVRKELPARAVPRKGKDGKIRKLPTKAPAAPGKVLSDEELADIEQRAIYGRLSLEEGVERAKRIVSSGGQEALEADAQRRAEMREQAKEERREEARSRRQEAAPGSPAAVRADALPGGDDPAPGCAACVEARDDTPEDLARGDGLLEAHGKGQEEGEQETLGWVAQLLGVEDDGATVVQVRQAIAVAIGRLRDTTDPDALGAAAARGYALGETETLGWVAEHVLQLPPFGRGTAPKLREEIEQGVQALREAPDALLRLALQCARELGEDRGGKAKRDALPPSAYAGPLHLLVAVQAALIPGRDLPWEGESDQAGKLWTEFAQSFLISRDKKAAATPKKRRS